VSTPELRIMTKQAEKKTEDFDPLVHGRPRNEMGRYLNIEFAV
jgi:hypothetical protein